MSGSKLFQDKPSKQTRENLHGEKEVGPAGDPARPIKRDAAARHDHVDVWMVGERRAPGVEDGENTDAGAKVLYRKDRVQCMMGQQYLEEHRLKPDSPTRRVIAKCCNSAMFLDFTKGHWLSMFRNRFPTGAPPLEMRVMTKERRVGVELADDMPNYSGHSGKFMLKLIAAWIAMGFRRPEITLGKTVHRAQ